MKHLDFHDLQAISGTASWSTICTYCSPCQRGQMSAYLQSAMAHRYLPHPFSSLSRPAEKYFTSTVMDCLQSIVLLSPTLHGAGEEAEGCEWINEVESGIKGQCGKGVGVFAFVSHHFGLVLFCNKLNVFSSSWICFACDSDW